MQAPVLVSEIDGKTVRFNSLQTGKCIARKKRKRFRKKRKGFNSLQTGKCIARWVLGVDAPIVFKVSIPFKRESVLQGYSLSRILHCHLSSFNSLQTGKCIARSSTSNPLTRLLLCFNSLQTGKCIASLLLVLILIRVMTRVSIPFKRESVLQVITLTKQI